MRLKDLNLNKIIKYLIYSDLIFYTGWGLISPIFAVFLLQNITGATAFVIGLSSAANLIIRSLLRIPFGMRADKSRKTAYNFMFFGLLIAALVPLGYIFSKLPWHIYLLQGILGASLAMSTAGWTAIFAKNMDKGKESTEWGVDAVAVGVGPGIAGAIGGLLVEYFSFNWVFAAVTIMGLIGAFMLPVIKKDIFMSNKKDGHIFIERELRREKKARLG